MSALFMIPFFLVLLRRKATRHGSGEEPLRRGQFHQHLVFECFDIYFIEKIHIPFFISACSFSSTL
jgi:hypothetical protein